MADSSRLLIVRQRPMAHADLAQLIEQLRTDFEIDPYLARQRLVGPGLGQLKQGTPEALAGVAAALRQHGFDCWMITPPRPAFAPPRLRSLSISSAGIEFDCEGERRVRVPKGAAVVGILADLSGELPSRQARRLLAQNAYLGRDQVAVFTPEEQRQAILKGQPVLDGYLLDTSGAISAAFRVLPGRFNPEGLGVRAGLGAVHNLMAIVDLLDEYAGSFRLYTDFGLSQLEGCQPQPLGENPRALQGNLDALTCYGWLVAGLDSDQRAGGDVKASPELLVAAVAGAGTAASEAGFRAEPAPPVAPAKPPPLPPPPARPDPTPSLRRALPVMAAFAGGLLLTLAGRTGDGPPFLRFALHSGAVTGLFAIALCSAAFACLRLKRRIEDTPTSRIRSLAMGMVEVHGRARRRYALVAPMTMHPCAWYRLRKYRRDSRNRWVLGSESDSNHVPFTLDDGSGQVAVDPAGAKFNVSTRQNGYPGETTVIGALVDGEPGEKWVEELVYEGSPLYVLGYARPERRVGSGLRERTAEALRLLKLDPHAQRRYDSDGDGRLDAYEWQAAHDDVERLAAAAQLNEQASQVSGQAIIGKPPGGLPFLIAEGHSGSQLSQRYGWYGVVLLGLGVISAGAALLQCLDYSGMK